MSSQSDHASTPSNSTAPPSSDTIDPSETISPKDKTPNTTSTTPNPRLTALEARKATLTQTLTDLKAQRQTLATQAQIPSGLTSKTSGEPPSDDEILQSALQSSNAVIKQHIALLHKYNEIKDIGQGLMGLIADQRDCRVVKVMEEFGVGEGD